MIRSLKRLAATCIQCIIKLTTHVSCTGDIFTFFPLTFSHPHFIIFVYVLKALVFLPLVREDFYGKRKKLFQPVQGKIPQYIFFPLQCLILLLLTWGDEGLFIPSDYFSTASSLWVFMSCGPETKLRITGPVCLLFLKYELLKKY